MEELNDDVLREILTRSEYEIILNIREYREVTDGTFWLKKYQYDLERSNSSKPKFFEESCAKGRVIYASIYLSNLKEKNIPSAILSIVRHIISESIWKLFVDYLLKIEAYEILSDVIEKLLNINEKWADNIIIRTVTNPNFRLSPNPSSEPILGVLLLKARYNLFEAILSNPYIGYNKEDNWESVLLMASLRNRLNDLLSNANILSAILDSSNRYNLMVTYILPRPLNKNVQEQLILGLKERNQSYLAKKVADL